MQDNVPQANPAHFISDCGLAINRFEGDTDKCFFGVQVTISFKLFQMTWFDCSGYFDL